MSYHFVFLSVSCALLKSPRLAKLINNVGARFLVSTPATHYFPNFRFFQKKKLKNPKKDKKPKNKKMKQKKRQDDLAHEELELMPNTADEGMALLPHDKKGSEKRVAVGPDRFIVDPKII